MRCAKNDERNESGTMAAIQVKKEGVVNAWLAPEAARRQMSNGNN